MEDWLKGYVETNGLSVRYQRSTGPGTTPILLLHGLADSGLCWPQVARDLSDTYDVIMPDARGHGQTQGNISGFSIPMLADDVAAIIRALDLDRPYLYGHSMGAITAATVAANYPDRVRAVLLEDPPLITTSLAPTGDDLAARHTLLVGQLTAVPPEERVTLAQALNPRWAAVEIPPWVESKLEFNNGVPRERTADMSRYGWREVLARVTCPALLITGDPDRQAIIAPATAQEAIRLLPDGTLAHIPGAGHSIHRDRYPETMAAVWAFLHSH